MPFAVSLHGLDAEHLGLQSSVTVSCYASALQDQFPDEVLNADGYFRAASVTQGSRVAAVMSCLHAFSLMLLYCAKQCASIQG